MTVADLITELQRLPPDLPVRVLLDRVYSVPNDGEITLCESDALPLDTVRRSGGYVLLTGE